jgi:hypothetical protein
MKPPFTAMQLADWLQSGAEDPMWADHTEIPKFIASCSASELRRLSAIEDEWARLSQDEGKTAREIERLRMMNRVLLETLKAAYNHAANHDESLPFDWALHCEMLHTGEMLHTAITKAEEQS